MSIVVLKPTPLAAKHFAIDPLAQKPTSAILSAEEYGPGIPVAGQKIVRGGVTLVVLSVDTEIDDVGNHLHRALVGLETEVH